VTARPACFGVGARVSVATALTLEHWCLRLRPGGLKPLIAESPTGQLSDVSPGVPRSDQATVCALHDDAGDQLIDSHERPA
jgi:hypothetical protein